MAGGLFITLIWYCITFLIYFDISFHFETKIKRKGKKFIYFKEKRKDKKKKKFDSRPPGIKPGPTDSESDVF